MYGTKSHLQTVGTGCTPVVLGLTFMLITVRAGINGEQKSTYSSAAAGGGVLVLWHTMLTSARSTTSGADVPIANQQPSLRGIQVENVRDEEIKVLSRVV